MTKTELSQYIDRYKSWGFCLLPIQYKSKKPQIKWQLYQKRKPSDNELESWFHGNNSNIAIVCGAISGNLVVLDCDNEELYLGLSDFLLEKFGQKIDELTPIVKTGGGGYHIYLMVRQLPHLYHPTGDERKHIPDIQSEGGYVLAPPSIHPSGNPYRLLNPQVTKIFTIESLSDIAIDIPSGSASKAGEPVEEGKPILPGDHDRWLFRRASSYRRAGDTEDIIFTKLQVDVQRLTGIDPNRPYTDKDLRRIAKSAVRYPPNTGYINTCICDASQQNESEANRNRNATQTATAEPLSRSKTQQEPWSKRIEDWVTSTGGRWFDTPELDRELGITSTTAKNNRREIMLRLEDKGTVERHQKIAKQFRYVNRKVVSLCFKTAGTRGVLALRWPMGIEKYVNLFPGNEIVVAGSPNAGKTALLLNFIYLNQASFPIYYFCSEMGDVELRDRLEKFPGMAIEDWKFEAIERASDFADVIRPDCVNVIDYMEMTTELYLINTYLTSIAHKLGSGIAVVALQKKEKELFGRGQEFGLEKPKLYLSMDRGKLRIVKGKCWANPKVDPCGLEVGFKIVGGCQFEITNNWDWKR